MNARYFLPITCHGCDAKMQDTFKSLGFGQFDSFGKVILPCQAAFDIFRLPIGIISRS